jgi:hypothetical protein
MNIDPTRNVVVFLLARDEEEHPIADAPTRDEDGIQQASERVAREHPARSAEVIALYSDLGSQRDGSPITNQASSVLQDRRVVLRH